MNDIIDTNDKEMINKPVNNIKKCNIIVVDKNAKQLKNHIKIKKDDIIDAFNNKSPLRYPGGKSKACKIIEEILIKHVDITTFTSMISPFFGGGSFEFYMQNKYHLTIKANDKFEPLYIFWNTAKNNKIMLCDKIKTLKSVDKEKFMLYRNNIMNEQDPLIQASYYFVINRSSFSGATLSGGFSKEAASKRFTDNSIKLLENINLSLVEFFNKDFSEFIEDTAATEKRLIFLDPPYYLGGNSKLYGYKGDMHEKFNHELLAQKLYNTKNWMLCYNNCEFIKTLYKDYKIVEVDWSYGMNKTKKSSEILILNFN